jgi:hypothetical protein
VEYGTYDTLTHVRPALVADHWLHAQGPVTWSDKRTQAIKQRLKNVMFPEREDWREAVLWRSRQVIRLAGEGMAKL